MQISVVGIGPGSIEDMTLRVVSELRACDVIVGYDLYIELVKEHFSDKDFLSTPMKGERKRCLMALEESKKGRRVALISSGDACVYGLASLMMEIASGQGVNIKVYPGVTAALSGGALLGSPLTNDFCVISLSDLLTPYEVIMKRVRAACEGDLVIALYNPRSKKRHDYLEKAMDIVKEYRPSNTIVGIAKNISRSCETAIITTVKDLDYNECDMFSTIFIGNSDTKLIDGKMVTVRGY